MAITITYELGNKPNRFGRYSIYLRITQARKHKRIKSPIEVNKQSDFDKNPKKDNWIRQSEPNHKVWNATLAKDLTRAKEVYLKLREKGTATSDQLVSTLIQGEKSSSFLEYARQRTQEIYNEGGIRNWRKYNGFCNKLEGFLTANKLGDLTFAQLTPSLLSKFKSYLHSLRNQREPDKMLHQNTIALNLRIFNTLVKRAIEIDNLIKPEKNPFLSFKYSTIKTTKEKLTQAELQAIWQLDLEEGTRIWDARNFFFFSYYCAGIRAGDFIQLRWLNVTTEGRLIYQMGKNHKTRDLLMVKQAQDILDLYRKEDAKPTDYIFPLLDNKAPFANAVTPQQKDTLSPELKKKLMEQVSSKTSIINNNLNKIRKMIGLEKKLTFHISRHTFASQAKQMGVAEGKIKNILAHSKLQTTEGYMGEFATQETDRVLTTIFEDNSPKTQIIALLDKMQADDLEKLMALIQSK